MTKIIVKQLVFDKYNLEHIKTHEVTQAEIEEVGKNFVYHRKTHTSRYLAVGRVRTRIITIVIRREAVGRYYPVTARDASKKERRALYEKESK